VVSLRRALIEGAGFSREGYWRFGNVPGICVDITFCGTTWYWSRGTSWVRGIESIMVIRGMPEAAKAALSGAKTVYVLELPDRAGSRPARTTAALRKVKFGFVFTISPIEGPVCVGKVLGTGSGIFLLQEPSVSTAADAAIMNAALACIIFLITSCLTVLIRD
jgi:hypothetical protein